MNLAASFGTDQVGLPCQNPGFGCCSCRSEVDFRVPLGIKAVGANGGYLLIVRQTVFDGDINVAVKEHFCGVSGMKGVGSLIVAV